MGEDNVVDRRTLTCPILRKDPVGWSGVVWRVVRRVDSKYSKPDTYRSNPLKGTLLVRIVVFSIALLGPTQALVTELAPSSTRVGKY